MAFCGTYWAGIRSQFVLDTYACSHSLPAQDEKSADAETENALGPRSGWLSVDVETTWGGDFHADGRDSRGLLNTIVDLKTGSGRITANFVR